MARARPPQPSGRVARGPLPTRAARSPKKGSDVAHAATDAEPERDLDGFPHVGPALRRLREERGLSLERLAQAAGVSRAMLGQVELGQSVPTIKTVWRVARALEVPFSALLGHSRSSSTIVLHPSRARVLTSHDGSFRSRALFPFGGPRKVEFYELTLAAGGEEEADPHAPGTVENLVVNAGLIEVGFSGELHRLEAGDAIIFDADRPHVYRNVGAGDALMYLVITYGLGREGG